MSASWGIILTSACMPARSRSGGCRPICPLQLGRVSPHLPAPAGEGVAPPARSPCLTAPPFPARSPLPCRLVQEPGTVVVTMPGAYHAGCDTGACGPTAAPPQASQACTWLAAGGCSMWPRP